MVYHCTISDGMIKIKSRQETLLYILSRGNVFAFIFSIFHLLCCTKESKMLALKQYLYVEVRQLQVSLLSRLPNCSCSSNLEFKCTYG